MTANLILVTVAWGSDTLPHTDNLTVKGGVPESHMPGGLTVDCAKTMIAAPH